MEIPESVQVAPREIIDDQRAITPNEINPNVSGVQQASAFLQPRGNKNTIPTNFPAKLDLF